MVEDRTGPEIEMAGTHGYHPVYGYFTTQPFSQFDICQLQH